MDFDKWMIEHLLYPAMEWKNGNRIRQKIKELKQSEQMPAAALKELQRQRLCACLKNARDHVPVYASLPFSDEMLSEDPYACLQSIPPLKKEQFRSDAAQHLCAGVDEAQLIANRTGGSTGMPLKFYMDRNQVESYEAARWRGLSWFGVTPGSRSVMIWGNPIELDAAALKSHVRKEKYLKNRIVISAYAMNEAKLHEVVEQINRYRPEYLYGYATAIGKLAEMMQQHNLRLSIALKVVATTSETLHPWTAELIQNVFQCPVANEYGARDAGILGYSCPCGNVHVTEENAVVEVLDPVTLEPVNPGEIGVLAVTDLHNMVQPRLRYLIGDLAALEEEPCCCGRPQRILSHLEGREDTLLKKPNGELVHGVSVSLLARERDCISTIQLEQLSVDKAILRIVLWQKTQAQCAEELQGFIAAVEKLLDGVQIQTQIVDEIPPEKSGKFRYAVRRFAL